MVARAYRGRSARGVRPRATAGSRAAGYAARRARRPGRIDRWADRHAALERARRADRRRQHPRDDRGRLGPPHVVDVVRAPAGRPVRRPPALRRRRTRAYRAQRPVRDVEGPRRAGAVRGARRPSARSTTTMLLSLRQEGSPLQGHPAPVPELPWVDVASGLARAGARRRARDGARDADGRHRRRASGSCSATPRWPRGRSGRRWRPPPSTGSATLTAILDLNRLGQRGPTMHGWHGDVFRDRAEAFGWTRDPDRRARRRRRSTAPTATPLADDRPTLIVARTEKGHGVSFLADQEGWHGKAVPGRAARRGDRRARRRPRDLRVHAAGAAGLEAGPARGELRAAPPPAYDGPIATRKAFGDALAWLAGHRPDLVVLDGEVGQLDLHRGRRGASRPSGSSSCTSPSSAWSASRPGCRRSARPRGRRRSARSSRARLRPDPDGRDQPRGPAAVRLARRRVDRRGRAVADGGRGPRDVPRAATARPCSTPPTARARSKLVERDVRPRGRLVPADHPRGDASAVRPPTRRSRSAGRRPSPQGRTTT